MNLAPKCSECGAELVDSEQEGLCTSCLLARGLDDAAATGAATPHLAPLSAGKRAGAADATATESDAGVGRLKPEERGERIGNYRLLEQIGQGGFGTVWMAEQERPVRRRVALKIIKLGMDTREVIARFEQERQALAVMDHPNIAKVHDAGTTPFGRPFFVMELVRGVKITDYCDQARLATPDRLQLFIAVCQAVQHAHQKGIIHRDLKPSNILVTLHDGLPMPKVIDFGVAKATQQQRLTDLTVFTRFEQMIGTPLYMSPEQAEMSGIEIDARSDIYSLGVLLYELLTGRTPFDPEALMRQGQDEIRRAIREQEPQKPSAFLSTMAADLQARVAQHRQADGTKLARLLRGDLDWIVMKALEKERTRRYESATALAMDLQRHLTNQPVLARAPSRLYRLQRVIRRNKQAVAAAGAVLLALAVAPIIHIVLKPKEERRSAAIRPIHPEAFQAYQLGQYYYNKYTAADNLKAIELLERAVTLDKEFAAAHAALAACYVEQIYTYAPYEYEKWEAKTIPGIQRALDIDPNLAGAYVTRARFLWSPPRNFRHDEAAADLHRALELEPNSPGAHATLVLVYGHTGLLEEALAAGQTAAAPDPLSTGLLADVGSVLVWKGDYEEALALWPKIPKGTLPYFVGSHEVWTLFALRRTAEAVAKLDELLTTYPADETGELSGVKAMLQAAAGDRAGAEAQIESAQKKETRFGEFHHTAYFIAAAYSLLHNQHAALTWLKKTATTGFPCYPLFAKDANLDPLRGHPEFQSFLQEQKGLCERRREMWLKPKSNR